MALITFRETVRQKPLTKKSENVKLIESKIKSITSQIVLGKKAFLVITNLGATDRRLISNLKGIKDSSKALEIIYNYIFYENGEGVLKEYNKKFIPFKGTAIGGMECHSPGH